jgi:hypothetical protein
VAHTSFIFSSSTAVPTCAEASVDAPSRISRQ